MKTSLNSLVDRYALAVPAVLAILAFPASGCGNYEEGFAPEPAPEVIEEGIEIEDQLVDEDSIGWVEADARVLSAGVKGGPPRRVLKGRRSIVCAGIKWQNVDKPGAGTETCNNLSRRLAEYYRDNSRGLLTLVPVTGHTVEVPYNGNRSNVYKAEQIVLKTFNADYYVIPSIYTNPHAGGKIAHVKSAQFMTAAHETGHLLGLGHAGAYKYQADGSVKLDAYGDNRSIMGNSISSYLSPSQYYYLGWLPEDEVAMYDPAVPSYLLKQIGDFSTDGLATVMVPPVVAGGRWAFIGATQCSVGPARTCVTLHLANGGGSQRVAEFSNELYDERFTKMHIKVLGFSGQRARISIDYAPRP